MQRLMVMQERANRERADGAPAGALHGSFADEAPVSDPAAMPIDEAEAGAVPGDLWCLHVLYLGCAGP